eukprot:symbB.v1.2.015854.t1/scaffold1163.1/size134625/14
MGTVCATSDEAETTKDPESQEGPIPWVGIDTEPLWKQVANAQIERKKTIQEEWPEVEKQLSARAFVKASEKAKETVRQEVIKKEETAKKEEKTKPMEGQANGKAATEGTSGPQRPKVVKLSKAQAKEALKKAIAIFEKPENKKKLKQAAASCGEDSSQRITTLLPVVKGMLADLLESYDFPVISFFKQWRKLLAMRKETQR